MYNGIGLTTARGSGTSGYVQKNLSTLNKSKQKHEYRTEEDIARMEAALNRPANQDILEHQKKRKIEAKVYEERERLLDAGIDEEKIEKRLQNFRKNLIEKSEKEAQIKEHKLGVQDRRSVRETHELAQLSSHRNDKLKKAFGISKDFKDGSSLKLINPEKESLQEPPVSEKPSTIAAPPETVERPSTSETDTALKRYRIIEDSDSDEQTEHKKSSSSKRSKSKSPERSRKRSLSPPARYVKATKESKNKKDSSKKRHRRDRSSSSSSSSDSIRSDSRHSSSSSDSRRKSRSSRRKRHDRSRSPRRDSRRRSRSRERRPASPNFRESRRITSL